jgi:hypothetical protein
MHGHDLGAGIAENYRAFAEEARGRSPAYERLATAVCDDPAIAGSPPPSVPCPPSGCPTKDPASCPASPFRHT